MKRQEAEITSKIRNNKFELFYDTWGKDINGWASLMGFRAAQCFVPQFFNLFPGGIVIQI